MFPFAHLYLPITLTQDEPLFGYKQGETVKVNLFESPKSSDLCVVADKDGSYSIRRFECIHGVETLWPPIDGTIRGTVVRKSSAPLLTIVEKQIA